MTCEKSKVVLSSLLALTSRFSTLGMFWTVAREFSRLLLAALVAMVRVSLSEVEGSLRLSFWPSSPAVPTMLLSSELRRSARGV